MVAPTQDAAEAVGTVFVILDGREGRGQTVRPQTPLGSVSCGWRFPDGPRARHKVCRFSYVCVVQTGARMTLLTSCDLHRHFQNAVTAWPGSPGPPPFLTARPRGSPVCSLGPSLCTSGGGIPPELAFLTTGPALGCVGFSACPCPLPVWLNPTLLCISTTFSSSIHLRTGTWVFAAMTRAQALLLVAPNVRTPGACGLQQKSGPEGCGQSRRAPSPEFFPDGARDQLPAESAGP